MARTNVCISYVSEFQSHVIGHQVYKDIWTPTLGEKLSTTAEPENHNDKYVVKVLKDNEVVGHVPVIFRSIVPPQFCVGGLQNVRLQGKDKTNVEWA